ncbi:hypothetical protein ACOMHN_006084 [Nucella lapillus]
MLQALEYLEEKSIIHGDIKSNNFLLDDPSDPSTIKLCDFGLSDKLPRIQTALIGSCGNMYSVVFILSMISLVYAQKAPCFQFPGHTFLEFKPNNMNISHKVHYSLMVKTKSPEGVVLYAEGPEDYEAVYLREGRLVYLLTNPSPSGVEGTSGGIYVTTDPVNNGNWHEVDVWRNWEPEEEHYHQQKELRTGLRVRDTATGTEESHLDDLLHRGVRFNDTVYFGGVISTAIPVVVSQRRSQDNTLFLPDCVPCTTPNPPSSPDVSLCSTARPSRANLQNLIKVPLQSSDLPNQLCVCLFNAKSVGVARKRTAIADFLADHDVDVMVLTETWLKESGDESKIADLTPPGYKLFSFPRQLTDPIKGGGGIAVIMKDCLASHTSINTTLSFTHTSFERHTKGSASPDFVGQIREMYEEGSDVDFDLYSLNFVGKVTPCS